MKKQERNTTNRKENFSCLMSLCSMCVSWKLYICTNKNRYAKQKII